MELARRKYGSNDLTNQKQDTIIHCIKRTFVNPFSVVLFFLGVISLFADVLLIEGKRSNATSVIIIFSMLFISRALVRTFKKMKDYILENRDLIGQREAIVSEEDWNLAQSKHKRIGKCRIFRDNMMISML